MVSELRWRLRKLVDVMFRRKDRLALYRALLRAIVDKCNGGKRISFTRDAGGNELTIWEDNAHTHAGCYDTSLDALAEQLHSVLTGGPGLSWFEPEEKGGDKQ